MIIYISMATRRRLTRGAHDGHATLSLQTYNVRVAFPRQAQRK